MSVFLLENSLIYKDLKGTGLMINNITINDMEYIYNSLSDYDKEKLKGSKILVTGFAGSLGYTLLHFFALYSEKLGIGKVYGIDTYLFGKPQWLGDIEKFPIFDLNQLNITNCDLNFAKDANIIFHMASLASPIYYRQHPLETIDADVVGIRRLLDFYKDKNIKGLLFYSSSETYGEPSHDKIPTNETYWGNVNTCGPRACYDESKRFGETLCYYYAKLYSLPVVIVRPFNNYGPGMRLDDQRVVADFAKNIINNEDIVIYSDGKPTRTFDYIPDATVGYIKAVLYGRFQIFNIGSDAEEISISELANIYKQLGNELFSYDKSIIYKVHSDVEYLVDNPSRRCPDITKAKELLGFSPRIHAKEGIKRYLQYSNDLMGNK